MTRRSFTSTALRKLYWSTGVSEIGSFLSWLFLTVFVYRESQSAMVTSLFFLATRIPRMLLAGAIGRWVDQNKNKINTHAFSLILYTFGLAPLATIKQLQTPSIIILFFSALTIIRTAIGISRTVTLKEICPQDKIRKAAVILENIPLIMVGVGAITGLILGSSIAIGQILFVDICAQIISIAIVWKVFRPDKLIVSNTVHRAQLSQAKIGFIKRELEVAKTILNKDKLFGLVGQMYILLLIFGSHPLLMSFFTGSHFKDSAKAFSAYNFGGALGALLAVLLYDRIKLFLDHSLIQTALVVSALIFQILTLTPLFSLDYQNLIWIGVLSVFIDFSFLALYTNTKSQLIELCHRDELGKTLGFVVRGEYIIGIFLTVVYGSIAKSFLAYQLSALTALFVATVFVLGALLSKRNKMRNTRKTTLLLSLLLIFGAAITLFVTGPHKRLVKHNTSTDMEYKVPFASDIQDLDPQTYVNYSKYIVMRQIYETLVRIDQRLNLAPGLAEKWIIDRGSSTITFFLRDAHFTDSSPVTSIDIKRCFLSAVQKNVSQFSSLLHFKEIQSGELSIEKSFEVLSDRSFRIFISQGETERFLRNLSLVYAAIFKPTTNSKSYFLGSGPFKVALADFANGKVELTANREYLPMAKRPHQLTFIRTPFERLYAAFSSGQIDEFDTGNYSLLKVDPPESQRVPIFSPTTRFLAFNCRSKVFSVPGNRLNFAALWPKKILGLAPYTDLIGATGLIPKGLPGHLMIPNSLPREKHGTYPTQMPRRRVVLGTANPLEYQALTEYFKTEEAFSTNGWNIEVKLFSSSKELIEALKLDIIDARIFANTVKDYDSSSLLETLHTGHSDNIYGISDKIFDALLEKAKRSEGPKRETILGEADARLIERAYIIPIGYSNDLKVVRLNCPDFVCTDSLQAWDRQYLVRDD